jgi:hypothetical protein
MVIGAVAASAHDRDIATPAGSLARDRATTLLRAGLAAEVFGLAVGAAVTVLTDQTAGYLAGAVAAVTTALTAALVGGFPVGGEQPFTSRWLPYVAARLWLASRGRLPIRLMAFLDDAHRRGVLRQTGRTYEFRHAVLQQYLAAYPDPAVGLADQR